jgi:hypothetical protein
VEYRTTQFLSRNCGDVMPTDLGWYRAYPNLLGTKGYVVVVVVFGLV